MHITKGPIKEGFYITSSCGCGDESAITIEHVQCCQETVSFSFSPDEARQLAQMLIDVANDYDSGIATGMEYGDPPVFADRAAKIAYEARK